MRTTHSLKFYCRESKQNKQGYSPIELSIIINGRRTFINLPRKERPAEFRRLTSAKRDNDLKQFLKTTIGRVHQIETELIVHSIPITVDTLREYMRSGGFRTYTVQSLFEEFNEYLSTTGNSASTKRKYQLVMDLWASCSPTTDELESVTNLTARKFYAFLQSKYEQSTTAGMATKIKAIYQYAVNNGKLKSNPFNGIRIDKGVKEVEYLTKEELSLLRDTPMPTESLERVRDLFIFQSGTGLAYADMAALTPEDVNECDGSLYIAKNRVKTNVRYTTVILPSARAIYEKYQGRLPVISNQKYNLYLKAVQSICGIGKTLHTHLARHTFATLCLNSNVRVEVVAKALGHTQLRQTQHYAKLIERTAVEELSAAFKD